VLFRSYPGSARVWRKGETGPRSVNLVDFGPAGASVERVVLAAAGQYREISLPLEPDGNLSGLEKAAAGLSTVDYVLVRLSGVVENEKALRETLARTEGAFAGRVRKLEFDSEGVMVMEGFSSLKIVGTFLDFWKNSEPPDVASRNAWLRAREIGLKRIKEAVEARR
jgi:hypothetical protein